jgi:hypothetical protein
MPSTRRPNNDRFRVAAAEVVDVDDTPSWDRPKLRPETRASRNPD